MRTALDVRVSTIHHKPDRQAESLRRYALRAGLAMVAASLDGALSGRKEGRPQLQALMRAARHHACGGVLVWKFDRFAHSVAHLLKALEELHHLGMRCISVPDHVDTERAMGQAMLTVIGVMAERASAFISERGEAGMEAAKARGKPLGRPATPLGRACGKRGPDDRDAYASEHGRPPRQSPPGGERRDNNPVCTLDLAWAARGAVRYIPRTPVRSVGQASASLQVLGLLYSSGKGLTQGMWRRARASNGFSDYKR